MLHLTTFGGPSVDIDGTPGSGAAQQRKTLALLALLAATGHRGLSRDKLIASLWPETDAEHGRALLNQACYALRRDLGTPDLFLGSIQLRLNPVAITSDVGSFASALDENDPARAVACYAAPFLDGFYLNGGGEFEDWAESERARLASQYQAALEVLAHQATTGGEHRLAAERWRRLLEVDPMSSHAALGLMAALDQAGERAEALRRGEAYGELVRSELGTDPPAELSQWIEQHRHVAGNGGAGSRTAGRADMGAGPSIQPVAAGAPPVHLVGDLPARRARGTARRWAAGIGLAGVVTAGILLSASRTDSATDPDLLAIVPFDVLDPSLQIWHEGLVDLLSRDLDGAGPLRTVAQSVELKRWHGRADRLSAERFGHRTGAGLVLFGTVSKARDTVSLRATVLDVARKSVGPDLEVKGDPANIGDLADSLGVRILQVLGRDRPIGAVRQVSIGSRSLPALKAFLYGEQFYRRGLWDSALVYYDRAIAQDSTFALAYRRMASVLGWHPASSVSYLPAEEYTRRSIAINHGLPPRDSLLIAADSFAIAGEGATDPADLIRFSYRNRSTLEEAARRYPADAEVWYELGDARFHGDRAMGGVPAAALEAFDRAIALDPGFAPGYEHVVNLALRLNRIDLARKYADAYLRLDPTDVNAPAIRLAALMLDPKRSHAPETARMIDSASSWVLFDAALGQLGWWPDSEEAPNRLLRALATRSGTGADPWSDTLMHDQFLAIGLAYRGHLHEAYRVDRRLILNPSASPFSATWDPFPDLSLMGVIPESLAANTFSRALEPGTAWPMPDFENVRQLRGLPWWLARRDTASLARFAHRAEQEAGHQRSGRGKLRSRYLHLAATAYLALARADSAEALRLFQAIPDTLCLKNDCYNERLTEARLLNSLGQPKQAAAVLDQWVWSSGPLFGLGVLEQGRIAERLGQRKKAIDCYQFVVNVWPHADPELEPYVREALAGLARARAGS
jgi:serine/threonine-protein kinase